MPVTETLILKSPLGSLLGIVITPGVVPTVPGVAVTVNVPVPPAGIGFGDTCVTTNAGSEEVIVPTFNGNVPVLTIENVYGEVGFPTTAEPIDTTGPLFVTPGIETVACGAAVPVTDTFTTNEGVVGSFVTIVIVPVFAPTAAGVPLTVKVAVPFAAIVAGSAGEIAEIANPAEPVIEVKVIGALPAFLIDSDVYAFPCVATTAVPTEIAGELLFATAAPPFNTCNAGAGAAVPVTVTFTTNEGVFGSLVAIVIVPVFTPIAAGVPVTVNVAVPFAAIVAGTAGEIEEIAKPAEPVIEVNVNTAVPPFLIENEVYAVAAEATTAEPTDIAGVLLFVTGEPLFRT